MLLQPKNHHAVDPERVVRLIQIVCLRQFALERSMNTNFINVTTENLANEHSCCIIAIDLKSFYASVECIERGLDPMTTNLVVADESRTEKTICLAVSPSLKRHGIPGRPRLFEVVQKVRAANRLRQAKAPLHRFAGETPDDAVLQSSPEYAIDYIVAPPRMAHYLEYSARIYDVYLKYVVPEDIHVYSIDEVFMDVTAYLRAHNVSARELAGAIILDVLNSVGITATAGMGTNLYLAKIAMDVVAKKTQPDANGVRVAELDELSYRKLLWSHRPLTDFWRVGKGYAGKLEEHGLFTMGDIARCSLGKQNEYHNEDLLYKLFGVNAELLIDHACWGWEPCGMAGIKAYKPSANSIGSGQVLHDPYTFEKARLVVREMTDLLVLDLVDKRLVTDQIVLTIGYDRENLTNPEISSLYKGAVTTDMYGRKIPKHAHGTINLEMQTSSTKVVTEAVMELFDRIVDGNLLVRRVNIVANHVVNESAARRPSGHGQLELFTDYEAIQRQEEARIAELQRERRTQEAVLSIRKKFGKNMLLKGMNLEDGAAAKERNRQIGGHKA
jgi:DNA polymerase V